MIDEASACTGLSFRKEMLKQLQPHPADVLHDSCTGVYLHLGPVPRAVPLIDEQNSSEIVHSSVFARQACPPITVGQYRTSRVLQPGESANCEVYASRPWNAMGRYLERGRYTFQAEGEWLDRGVPVGPGGTWDGRFHPSEVFQLAGSFSGWLQERFRQLSGNQAATFFGAPRATGAPWVALIGVIAATEVDDDGAQQPYQPFMIGQAFEQWVQRPGYFYAYANDA